MQTAARRVGTFFALLVIAAGANAESLASTSSGSWSGVGGGSVGWSGGTPSPDDDFVIAAGHSVRVEGKVALTTGSVTVAAGGTLAVAAGSTLTPGDRLVVRDGASYEQIGVSLRSCRIRDEPDWSAADPSLSLSCGAQATPGTFLVFVDEDPPLGLWNGRAVVAGPGLSSGALRTSLNRYAWYSIIRRLGDRITYDLDSGTYDASPGAPYRGTRGNPTPAAIPAAQLAFVAQPGRRATRVEVAPGYGSVVATNADLGSHYLYFTEAPALAGDPTRCSGLAAKILHSEDGGAEGDRLYVAGDVTGCTHPQLEARIIPGARRGDRVALVRPAVLDGQAAGPYRSHVRFESGASLKVKWARFVGLGYATPSDVSPSLRRNCNVCFLQSATSPGATLSGTFEDVEIVLPEAGTGATNDTAVVHFDSLDGAQVGDYRYPDVGLLDLSGLTIARLHIHDSRNEAYTGGSHGIYVDGAKNLSIDGARIERMSDDLFGSNLGGNETGSATDVNSFDVRRLLLYEAIAEHDNSQQCFEPAVIFGNGLTATGVHNYARQAGAIRATDVVAIGCHKQGLHVVGLGAVVDRIVSGGSSYGSDGSPVQFYLLANSGVPPSAYPNVVRNAVLTTYVGRGANAGPAPMMIVRLEDSVLFGDEQHPGSSIPHQGFQACVRSFWYHDGSSGHALEGNWQSNNVWGPLREWEDCAFVSASADRLASGFTNFASPHTLRFRRFLYLQTAGWSASGGPLGAITTEALANVDLRGAFLSTEAAGTKDFDANPGGVVQDVCFESLNSPATDFQGYASATTLSVPSLAPDVSDEPTVGSLVGDPASSDVCERAKPAALGLAEIGSAHALLGDFALMQLYPAYSSHAGLLQVVREAPPPPVGCGLGPELAPALALLAALRRRHQRALNGGLPLVHP